MSLFDQVEAAYRTLVDATNARVAASLAGCTAFECQDLVTASTSAHNAYQRAYSAYVSSWKGV